MTNLVHTGFLVTLFTTVEDSLLSRASSIYNTGRKHVPSKFQAPLDSLEDWLTGAYSTARSWFEQKGTAWLKYFDSQAESARNFSKAAASTYVPASVFEAHRFWVDKCAEVSTKWKEQGVLYGTVMLAKEAFRDAYATVAEKVLSATIVRRGLAVIQDSAVLQMCNTLYHYAVQPLLLQVHTYYDAFIRGIDNVRMLIKSTMVMTVERIDRATIRIVAHPIYAQVVMAVIRAKIWLQTTYLYSTTQDRLHKSFLGPYVSAIVRDICQTQVYADLISRLAPVKHD